MLLPPIQNLAITETPTHSTAHSSKNTSPLGAELLTAAKGVAAGANLLTGLPDELLEKEILPKLGANEHRSLHSMNKALRAVVPLLDRATEAANLKQTLLAINSEQANTPNARNTSILSLKGQFSLADFKDLPACPKITKLLLPAAPLHTSGVTQETPLDIAKIFPNLQQLEANGLNDVTGKIISEMLATETLKSLKLENVDKQVDTLSGPLHHMQSNNLKKLLYSESANNPRNDFFSGLSVDMQLDKLLETSKNLKNLSLTGHFGLDIPNTTVQARCLYGHAMQALTHFEMKNAPNMAEEFMAYMIQECRNMEHLDLSNNPKGVGTSFNTLLGKHAIHGETVFPLLKRITFWNNATVEPKHALRGGSFAQQVENSLKLLGTHKQRLQQLDLKVGDNVSEDAVMSATQSVKHGGKLTLGLSQQVTAQTVEILKAQRPDLHVIIK